MSFTASAGSSCSFSLWCFGMTSVCPVDVGKMSRNASVVSVSLIFFDGEELGRPGAGPYCAGSRALGQALAEGRYPLVRAARFGIVLDMVGDRDLEILQDPRSRAAASAI